MSAPHATIRPYALTEEEAKNAPAQAKIVDIKAGKGKGVYKFAIAISPLDCMGCSVCVSTCPVKALTMKPQESQAAEQEVFDYMVAKVAPKADVEDTNTVKGSQFKQPLLEFSGSCAGCAETAYARLVTQVCGDRHVYSNATGCSSIWGGPAATSPYTVNKEGKGPAWANSLFEDNAEHGLGLHLGQKAIRSRLADKTRALLAVEWCTPAIKETAQKWLDTMEDGAANAEATKAYIAALEDGLCTVDELLASSKPEIQAFGKELQAKGEKLCQCDACSWPLRFSRRRSIWLRSPCGSSAATAGLTTSATAAWITSSPPARTSTSSSSIPRSIPTPADRPPSPPISARWPSLPPPARTSPRRALRRSPCSTATSTWPRWPWAPTPTRL